MLSEGSLWTTPFVEILRLALESRVTGWLDLVAEQVRRRLVFREGLPVSARSNLLSENLFRFLLRRGLLDRTTYTQLLSEEGNRGRGGAVVVERGLATREQVAEAERALSEEIVLACLSWTEGSFTFTARADESAGEPLDIFEIYARWLGEQVAVDRVIAEALRFRERQLLLSDVGRRERRRVAQILTALPELSRAIASGDELGRVLEGSAERLGELVRGFTVLLHLGALEVVTSSGGVATVDPSVVTRSQADLAAVRRTSGPRMTLEHVRGEVQEALRLAVEARSPRAALGLSAQATQQEAQEAYRRLEELYRVDRFRGFGDEALLTDVALLRERLDAALEAILRDPSVSRPLPRSLPALRARRPDLWAERSEGEQLAAILYADGQCYLRMGDFEEAADHFRQAHKHSGLAPLHLAWYGWALSLCGEPRRPQGREALYEALRRDPLLEDGYVLLGNVLAQDGDQPRAIAAYRRALEINPSNREARTALVMLEA